MRRGFTLIELLTVIAVMAVLAALILSALSRAKGAAQKAACINDLHQINAAVLMYADDNADAIRPAANEYHIYFSYKDYIRPYLLRNGSSTNDQLFACPADDFDCKLPAIQDFFRPEIVAGNGFHQLKQTHYSSYIFNGAAANSKETRVAGKPFSSAREPSLLVLVCELSGAIGLSGHDRRQVGQFNNAKNVVSFIDGHVSFIPIYWNGDSGEGGMPITYDPPAGYEYIWFGK
ncbi:MAG TPA: type II secretion system protein [Candidatus Baltobacteraceae bacterium]|jgi:prepilin-type N-terminal cleavage/methylation domain-containing protein|nr:type II secretion system protein [Candidatus Baltobacteraceae bacterium]